MEELLSKGWTSFLVQRKHEPKVPANKTSAEIEELIVKAKPGNPGYGARRLHWHLRDKHGGIDWIPPAKRYEVKEVNNK